jgi:hypothetical protein
MGSCRRRFVCTLRSPRCGERYVPLEHSPKAHPHNLRYQAQKDDVLPLSKPITLADGSVTDHVIIAKGTTVAVNMPVMNRVRELWGDDAQVFRPERWVEGLPARAQEISGYRHLLSFLDGPKMCACSLPSTSGD